MKKLNYYVLDVFTDKRYRGNPLAVVFTDGNLEPDEYHNVSKEFGYSETSFVYYSKEQKVLKVRSFTPTGFEVAGAGHNLLGAVSAALLKGLPLFDGQDGNNFVMMKGTPIPMNVISDRPYRSPVVQMRQKTATLGQIIPIDKLAKALGLKKEDLKFEKLVPTVVKTEVAHTMVPINNIQVLNSCRPNNDLLIEISKQYGFEGFYCFAFADQGQENIVESRFFNPLIGIDEDAATGTAAGPLIGFLASNGYAVPNKGYRILQGRKLGHLSVIEVMAREKDILVGGSSTITMRGEIYL